MLDEKKTAESAASSCDAASCSLAHSLPMADTSSAVVLSPGSRFSTVSATLVTLAGSVELGVYVAGAW